jgi:hypothetical protein
MVIYSSSQGMGSVLNLVLLLTVGRAYHYHNFTISADVSILVLRTFPGNTLRRTFLDETPSLAPNGTMVIYSSSQGMGSVLNLVSTAMCC